MGTGLSVPILATHLERLTKPGILENAQVDQARGEEMPGSPDVVLQVVKLPEAKKGFVLLPRRWVVERSFAWTARFRRLSRDYERLANSLAALHYVAFAMLMLSHLARSLASS